MATAVSMGTAVSVESSIELVLEFLSYGINTILYQRRLYPRETFARVEAFGVPLYVTRDIELRDYLKDVLQQVKEWLVKMSIQKVVMLLQNVETKEIAERWEFHVAYEKPKQLKKVCPLLYRFLCAYVFSGGQTVGKNPDVKRNISSVLRQIVTSFSFLPPVHEKCTFEVLIHTDKTVVTPPTMVEADPNKVVDPQEARLRSFTSSIYTVDTCVIYRNILDDEEEFP